MRNIKYLALMLFALLTATACSDDETVRATITRKEYATQL